MLLEIELFKKQKKEKKKKKKKKRKLKIKIALSLGYSNSYFYKKDNYIYHFLDYIKLLLFVNANVIHHV